MSHVSAAFLDEIPSDILDEILCLLPLKCLLRLRCLSKSWLAKISSPEFVKLHLDRSAKTKINLSLFLWGFKLYRVDFDSLQDNNVIHELAVVDDHPLNNEYCLFQLWGSCNGLICMSNSIDIDTVFLWNPSTRKSIKLPHMSVEVPNHESEVEQDSNYGIGYTSCKDYKVGRVVEIRDLNGEFLDHEVMVYSLRSDSWHRSEKFHLCPNIWRTGPENTIVGGAMHWFSRLKSEESEEETLIVAFDLETEEYRVIQPPEFRRDPDPFPTYLHSLGECLSLICHYNLTTADIWLLKNYGDQKNESWMRLITMFPVTNSALMVHLIPVDYSKCGKKVLLEVNYEKLVWYDLEQRSVEDIIRVEDMALHTRKEEYEEEENVFAAITCLESLASVESSRRSKESVSRD